MQVEKLNISVLPPVGSCAHVVTEQDFTSSPCLCGFPPTSQKHAERCIGYTKLHTNVNVCVGLGSHSGCVPHGQCSHEHQVPDQNKEVTEDESVLMTQLWHEQCSVFVPCYCGFVYVFAHCMMHYM